MIKSKEYNEFIKTHDVLKKKNTSRFKRLVYSLGYFDGVYGEEEYKRYIPDDEECINLYANGYLEGKTDRENKTNKFFHDKPAWIIKLAVSDYKNGFRDRKLTEEALELYNIEYDDLNFYGVPTAEQAQEAAEKLEEKNIRI